MDLKIAARMTAVLALGLAMIVAFMALRGNGLQDASSSRSARRGGEPERIELARCRDIGMAAAADEACREVWAENRRRFLGPTPHVSPYALPSVDKDQSRLLPLQSPTLPGAEDQHRAKKVAP
ncbi:putative entry exclusion protein TrbK-alt [Mesorhizobium sp. M6A.T.Cr.TU.016.01.1.1]|uniref:putative entry exclusion protein TrbK-alt n=1 Tax=Mesorhizobium sp. M6A.T.Cr.TU.016.01.1.1 TaxID=2493677 RepID=UPI000F755379|nr:putative entry exclusion protein TrbK-alt [Mesorhizobium sp. M6A.T.Cr.TU.016.01.1.1]AZO68048.1 conjugal transfer protein TrbK [Mesorhizobium sp. M6A.T.Cr.TU.016.01.1.1]